ncbi:hypothetical protein B296_00040393, partial [Ensete ventricosum]
MDTTCIRRYILVRLLTGTRPPATPWCHRLGLFLPHYHPKSGGNGRFRPSTADFRRYQPREKEEEGEEEGEGKREPGVGASLLIPSPADDSSPCAGRRNVSP